MTELTFSKTAAQPRDDLSDVASSHIDERSLNDAPPEYTVEHATDPTALPSSSQSAQPTSPLRPTTANPFNFPISELPPYSAVEIPKPFAVPQIAPTEDAPFLAAFPSQLLSYGIPKESWHSFVDTLSAFLSAKVSQQAVHHAADIAVKISDYHKQYAMTVTSKVKEIGKSAEHLSPFGVLGGVLGLTFGGVGHIIGSVRNVRKSILSKPKTPRDRATLYVTAANQDWFHERGLHALMLDTEELATVSGTSVKQLLALADSATDNIVKDADRQMNALKAWIGEVEIRETDDLADKPALLPQSTMNTTSFSYVGNELVSSSSNTPGRQSLKPQLQIGPKTLWLVLTQEGKVQGTEGKGQ